MTTDSTRTDREAVLARLSATIDATHRRIENFDATTPAEQELLIKWIRTLGYLTGQYRQLLNDEELDEMADELDRLKSGDEDV